VRPPAVLASRRTDASGRVLPAVATTLTVPVDAGSRGVFFAVQGAGALPSFTLTGPHGEHRDVAATGAINDASGAVFHDATNNITYVGVPRPSAGVWTVTAAGGSPALTEMRTGVVRPVAAVTAHVVRVGTTYRLVYAGPKVAGQSVRFVERGTGDVATIGVVAGGGSGSLLFRPHAGSGARRTIVAMVSQDGLPRTEVVAGAYVAPAPTAPAAVGRITAVRHGTTVVASWKPVVGATGYAAVVRTSDGRSPVVVSRSPSFRFAGLAAAQSARISVTAFNGRLRSRASSVVVPALSLLLTKVRVSPTLVPRSSKRVLVSLTVNRAASVTLAIVSRAGTVLVRRTFTVRAGHRSLALALVRLGKRLPKGSYTVVVTAKVRGLPAAGTGTSLRLA
jgi:hypothetical protein